MSHPRQPVSVKLIVSLLYSDRKICDRVLTLLQTSHGEIDFCERTLPFSHTKYYEKEMGTGLQRCFISFKKLIDRHHLVEMKLLTNKVENSLANDDTGRTINIDPGYLTDSQLVLATGKNFSHRIYLGKGIFADLTLVFRDHRYQFLPWTYPDYKEDHMQEILMKVRKQYLKSLSSLPAFAGTDCMAAGIHSDRSPGQAGG